MNGVVGRFAPSPTGELHFGSLVAAVGSFLQARSAGGAWLIRVEDIDPPREVAGSAQGILEDLESLGMTADGPALFQSTRLNAYQQALEQLLANHQAFHCVCTRKDLPASGIYPGTCRAGTKAGKPPRSIRFLAPDTSQSFLDRVQGPVCSEADDFIIRRADGLFAYQLAVVVDDHFQGITHVVRGTDLLDSTVRQIALQKTLGYQTPIYSHLPIALGEDGKKLSKRHAAEPVLASDPCRAVRQALCFLGHEPPDGLDLKSLWHWAIEHWNIDKVPRNNAHPPTIV